MWQGKRKIYTARVVTVVSVFVFMKYILTLVMPFFLALCLIGLLQPIMHRLERVFGIRKRVLGIWLLLLTTALLGALLWYLGRGLCGWLTVIRCHMGDYEAMLNGLIHTCCQKAELLVGINAAAVEDALCLYLYELLTDIKSSALPHLMNRSVDYVRIFLAAAGFLVMTLIAAVLLAKDFRRIQADLQKYRWFQGAAEIGSEIGLLAVQYVKAQAKIMGAISIISCLGLWGMGIRGGWLLGLLAGVLDALPFIGTGIILLPTALWQLLQGNIWKSIGVLCLYALCALLREFLEPKLIGKQMDIYPVVVLLAIYTGLQLYGLSGVVLGPLSFLLIREIWRRIPDFCADD